MARRCEGLTLPEDQPTTWDGPDTSHRDPTTWGDATHEALGKLPKTFENMEQADPMVMTNSSGLRSAGPGGFALVACAHGRSQERQRIFLCEVNIDPGRRAGWRPRSPCLVFPGARILWRVGARLTNSSRSLHRLMRPARAGHEIPLPKSGPHPCEGSVICMRNAGTS